MYLCTEMYGDVRICACMYVYVLCMRACMLVYVFLCPECSMHIQ